MHYAFPFLPLEVQTSIKEIVALGSVPESAIDLLIARFAKAIEDKTTSLQMDLERIELSFERRYSLVETKLISDNQSRTSDLYQMISEVRSAQQQAHPQIAQAIGRLESAFVANSDDAAKEWARLEAKLDGAIERIEVIEEVLELKPKAEP